MIIFLKILLFVLLLTNLVNAKYTDSDVFLNSINKSDIVAEYIYDFKVDSLVGFYKQSLKPFKNKFCFKVELNDREHQQSFKSDYECNDGEFDVSDSLLLPPKTKIYDLSFNKSKLGDVEIISYPVVRISPTFCFMLLIYIAINFMGKLNKETKKEDINSKIFIKNKRMFPIRNDSFIYARYKNNTCYVFLKTGHNYSLRCSLDSLSIIVTDTKKIKRNILISNKCSVLSTNENITIKYEDKVYEI
ncbi:hypothetical protein VXS05_19435 [Photobacterium toruni]|uniref:hypothetical protein n=1 Tax=Photobacterium toruni TaxID=1935446 RepID=UPI002E1877D3|nr:hypothetical protein [Photobacterium toruni]